MQNFIACHECDLLQVAPSLKIGETAKCRRCGAILFKNRAHSIDYTLAFAVASAILFIIANIYPIIDIELSGNHSNINLFGATKSLWEQGMPLISIVVNITAIIIPAAELVMMLYLLIPLRLDIVPKALPAIMRLLQIIKPFGMLEVFMLGILVSLVKLTSNFIVIPGIALWSYMLLTFSLSAMSANFNQRDIWIILDRHDKKRFG